MCLIVYVKKGGKPDWKVLDRGAVSNGDGFGIMWHDGKRARRMRSMAWTPIRKQAKALIEAGTPCAIHQRMTTHGETSLANCHPYAIPGHGSMMMHNGMIAAQNLPQPIAPGRSDTHAVADWAGGLAKGFQQKKAAQKRLAKIAGAGKFLLMDKRGMFRLINASFGAWRDSNKVWYSNTNSFAFARRAQSALPYGRGGWDADDWDGSYTQSYANRRASKLLRADIEKRTAPPKRQPKPEVLAGMDADPPYIVDLELTYAPLGSCYAAIERALENCGGETLGRYCGSRNTYAWFGFWSRQDQKEFESLMRNTDIPSIVDISSHADSSKMARF